MIYPKALKDKLGDFLIEKYGIQKLKEYDPSSPFFQYELVDKVKEEFGLKGEECEDIIRNWIDSIIKSL